jgi:hypothetical protein
MAGYNSPLGNKQFNQNQLRQFDVPDMSELNDFADEMNESDSSKEDSQQEKQFAEARRMKAAGKERLQPQSKKRIEFLLNMTKVDKTVLIGETPFVLRSLNSRQVNEVLNEIKCSKN